MGKYLWIRTTQAEDTIEDHGAKDADPGEDIFEGWSDIREYRSLAGAIAEWKRHNLQSLRTDPPDVALPEDDDPVKTAAVCRFPSCDRPQVTVIVPVGHDEKKIVECLLSISTNTPGIPYEVIVVGDGSGGKVGEVLERVANIRMVRTNGPGSFAEFCNLGARKGRGAFLVFVPDDVLVSWNWLSPLVESLTKLSNVAAVGPKVVYRDGRLQQAGLRVGFDGSLKAVGEMDDAARDRYNYPRPVDYLSGTCLMVKAGTFAEISGFDTRLTAESYAGADISLVLRKRGKHILYNPESFVIRQRASETPSFSGTEQKHLESRQCFIEKWQNELLTADSVKLIAFYYRQPYSQPMVEQIRLAKKYGIHGWCFWCNRSTVSLQGLVGPPAGSSLGRFPFCLCWSYGGLTPAQAAEPLFDDTTKPPLVAEILCFMNHPDYIKINGKPLLVLTGMPSGADAGQITALWRRLCAASGTGEIYLAGMEPLPCAPEGENPARDGFDAAVAFPPHRLPARQGQGGRFDYREWALDDVRREIPRHVRFFTVVPSWNDAGAPADGSSPGAYQAWLEAVLTITAEQYAGDERLIFLYAWNDGCSGALLEPGRRHGHRYLEATANALDSFRGLVETT